MIWRLTFLSEVFMYCAWPADIWSEAPVVALNLWVQIGLIMPKLIHSEMNVFFFNKTERSHFWNRSQVHLEDARSKPYLIFQTKLFPFVFFSISFLCSGIPSSKVLRSRHCFLFHHPASGSRANHLLRIGSGPKSMLFNSLVKSIIIQVAFSWWTLASSVLSIVSVQFILVRGEACICFGCFWNARCRPEIFIVFFQCWC